MTTEKTLIPESHLDLLESTALAHIATLGPRGEPQSSPVWFGWDGDYVKFSQIKTRQKYKIDRIEEDPDLDFINSMSKKYLGKDRYPNHRPGDERVVVFVRPEHTTKKDR